MFTFGYSSGTDGVTDEVSFSNIVSASRELGDAAVNQKPFKVPVKNVKVLANQRMPFCLCLLRDLKEKALKAFFSIDHINFHF